MLIKRNDSINVRDRAVAAMKRQFIRSSTGNCRFAICAIFSPRLTAFCFVLESLDQGWV